MRGLIQRVSSADVTVEGAVIGRIGQGLLLLLGVERNDTEENVKKMLHKVLNYRVFADDDGKMNLSIKDINGGLLVVSQFTLAAETKKGLRPGFSTAAVPATAEALYDQFLALASQEHERVEAGRFGADMKVQLLNDGPVTFLLET